MCPLTNACPPSHGGKTPQRAGPLLSARFLPGHQRQGKTRPAGAGSAARGAFLGCVGRPAGLQERPTRPFLGGAFSSAPRFGLAWAGGRGSSGQRCGPPGLVAWLGLGQGQGRRPGAEGPGGDAGQAARGTAAWLRRGGAGRESLACRRGLRPLAGAFCFRTNWGSEEVRPFFAMAALPALGEAGEPAGGRASRAPARFAQPRRRSLPCYKWPGGRPRAALPDEGASRRRAAFHAGELPAEEPRGNAVRAGLSGMAGGEAGRGERRVRRCFPRPPPSQYWQARRGSRSALPRRPITSPPADVCTRGGEGVWQKASGTRRSFLHYC